MGARRTTRNSAGRKPGGPRGAGGPALDDDARNDMYGVALTALGIALMIAVLSEGTGVVAKAGADVLRSGFGVGAYVLPVLVTLWGVSFFIRAFEIHEFRVGAGLALVLASLVSIVALSAPETSTFDTFTVRAYGGFLGAGVSWALRSLFGTAISYVVLSAALVSGLVVTGLSISGMVEWLAGRFAPSRPTGAASVRRPAAPGEKTRPISDGEFAEPASVRQRDRRPAADPEARRKTEPTPPRPSPARDTGGFVLPPLSLLEVSPEPAATHKASDKELRETADVIESTLATFDITARVVGWIPGPTVTMFEVQLARGVKVHRITSLSDDLALALAAPTIRILAPIPGKSLVGIEVPNDRRSTVTLGDAFATAALADEGPLALLLGKDVAGETVVADMATMPHLLIAGATGTGKSVCINALLMTVLMRATPSEVRLILIDPKRIELSLYNGVPHLYVPVVTEAKESASALAWAVTEMESRLKRLQKASARNIAQYNAMARSGEHEELEPMSYLVIVIDELADLMMVAAREVEDSICRLAQLARAAGIHLIVATQRPSADIITGLIKANITNRIAFAVSQGIDSRVILDQAGAEQLVGRGDMLYSTPAWPKPKRIQGAFVSESEIEKVVAYLRSQGEPEYHEEILHLKVASAGGGVDSGDEDDDPLLWEAADIVLMTGMGSTSLLQRRLKVGYARAGRIMDMLEAKGVVGPPDGSRPREILVDVEDLEAIKAFERSDAGEAG